MVSQNRLFEFIEKVTTHETYGYYQKFLQFCHSEVHNTIPTTTYSNEDIASDGFQIYSRKNIWEAELIIREKVHAGVHTDHKENELKNEHETRWGQMVVEAWYKTYKQCATARRFVEIYRTVNTLLTTENREIYYSALVQKANEILEKMKVDEKLIRPNIEPRRDSEYKKIVALDKIIKKFGGNP